MEKNIVVEKKAVVVETPSKVNVDGMTQEEKNILLTQLLKGASPSVMKDITKKAQSDAEKTAEEFNKLIKANGFKALNSLSDIDRLVKLADSLRGDEKKAVKMAADRLFEAGPNRPVRVGISITFDFEPPKRVLKSLGGEVLFRRTLSETARKNDAVIAQIMAEQD